MKKFLHFSFLFFFYTLSFALTKEEIDSAVNDLCKKIMFKDPYSFRQENYADLAYLKRNFNLPYLNLKDSLFTKGLNDYYYKAFNLYGKLLREDAVVTEDCFQDDANRVLQPYNKLFVQVLYPNTMKMPSNVDDQIAEYASIDSFLGPYKMLKTIYFLKKYSNNKLSKTQQSKIAATEKYLSDNLYIKYVYEKPWNFQKFLSLQVLRMNEYPTAMIYGNPETNIFFLVKYFNANGPLQLGEEDMKQTAMIEKWGYATVMQFEMEALLWIFLTDPKKN